MKRYTHYVVIGRRVEFLAFLQRLEDRGRVRYYLSQDRKGFNPISGHVRCNVDPVEEYKALQRLEKNYGREIRPALLYSLRGDYDTATEPIN